MAKETTKKENKNKKSFFKEFKAELKKVIWPTPKQLAKSTTAVIFIVLVTAAIVFVLDFAFDALNIYGINRLKSAIKDTVSVEQVNETNEIVEDANIVEVNETSNEIVVE